MLTIAEVSELVRLGQRTILEWEKDGRFPASVRLGTKLRRWYKDVVLAWMATREPDPPSRRPPARRKRKAR
jgi:excisionase family DNA binding protein